MRYALRLSWKKIKNLGPYSGLLGRLLFSGEEGMNVKRNGGYSPLFLHILWLDELTIVFILLS